MEHNNIYRSVFKVTHSGGSGSCFYLKNYDLFVTNYHVVEGYRTVAVHDNDRNPYLAKVVLVNPALDIALLAAEGDFSALPERRSQRTTRLPSVARYTSRDTPTACPSRSPKVRYRRPNS